MTATAISTEISTAISTSTRSGGGATPAVRLTRRGRAVVLLALLGLLLTAFVVGRAGSSQAATERTARTPYPLTTVHAGETLWSVAKRVAPGHDPRAVVQQISELNHLTGGAVRSGQQLLLPHPD
jgi:hypothetical protein